MKTFKPKIFEIFKNYSKKQFISDITAGIIVAIIAVLFSLFIEKWSGVTYLLGAVMSSIVCILGMKSATYANVRTANTARETKNVGKTVKTALKGGSISGLSVQSFNEKWNKVRRGNI